jgi:hypothetical protein
MEMMNMKSPSTSISECSFLQNSFRSLQRRIWHNGETLDETELVGYSFIFGYFMTMYQLLNIGLGLVR